MKIRGLSAKHFHFLPPPHFGWLFFAFLAIWGSTKYVYKIWLSLVQRARILIFAHPPFFRQI